MRRRVLWLAAAAFAVGAFALGEVLSGGSSSGKAPLAPRLPTQVLVPPRATVASLRGRPAVIHFWASWCDPCRREAARLAQLPAALGSRAQVVGVDWNDSAGGARSFIEHFRWSFQNLRDASGAVGDRYNLTGLPTTYVLGPDGRIRATLHGPQTVASVQRAVAAVGGSST